MSEFPWEKKEKKRGLPALLALLGPHGGLIAAFLGLAGVFMGASLAIFRERGDQPSDSARLSAMIASQRDAERTTQAGPAPVAESPLPLPGILKQEQTAEGDKTGPDGKTATDGKGNGAKNGASQGKGKDQAAAGRDGRPGLGSLRGIQGSLMGQSGNGGGSGLGLLEKKGWPGNSKPGSSKTVRSGTYTNKTDGRNCSANSNDIPELKPMWAQLTAKRAFLKDNGCGDTPCRQCSGASKDCTCATARCEADKLYFKINSRLCGSSSAE